MRKSRFLSAVFVSAFITAFSAAAIAAPQGTCTPPGTWVTRTEFPGADVRSWGTFFPPDGRFYVMGGRASDDVGSDYIQVNIYDPATDTWSASNATFADGQVNNMVGGVLDFGGTQYIVVVGGSAAGATTATSEVRQYDPVGDAMISLTNDPWPGNANGTTLPGGAAVYENKLFVFGGYNISLNSTDTIYQFDPAAAEGSRWTTMTATLPSPASYIPAATSNGLIYVIGGAFWDATLGTPTLVDTANSFSYDPDTDTITAITSIPRATGETRAVTAPDGTIWVLGGGRTAPNPSNEVDVYDPVGDIWTTGPAFPTARRNFAADIDAATGTIWAIGGYDATAVALSPGVNEEFDACAPITDRIFADGFDPPTP